MNANADSLEELSLFREESNPEGQEPQTPAELKAEQAATRTEQTATHVAQVETRRIQAETQLEQADTTLRQEETRQEQARTQAGQELRASELIYRRLFEAAQDGILILDGETGRITDVNSYLVGMLGFSHEEMVGQTVGELSPFKDLVSNQAMLERVQAEGYVRYDDLPLEARDGRHVAVEFVSNVYQVGDKKVIQCNIRDITERKQAQDEIKNLQAELELRVESRTAELRAANAEMEAFSYSVSHDLRAPLRHVVGFIDLLEKDVGDLSEKSRRYLKTIAQSANRMGALIDDLLSFSRIGKSAMRKTEVKLEGLVQEVLAEFLPETKDRRMSWMIHPLPTVQADRALIQMVLTNLIGNAIKFTSGRTVAEIELGTAPSKADEVVIFIRDNGAGFDPKYSPKLFGVFQRLHSQADFPGTGIGLANVQRIVHRHGGRVWAEGAVDVGATFFFSLPTI